MQPPNRGGQPSGVGNQAEKQGLPSNNTEVLDFLRSVADLMEKDGQTDLAQGIKNSMGHQPQ